MMMTMKLTMMRRGEGGSRGVNAAEAGAPKRKVHNETVMALRSVFSRSAKFRRSDSLNDAPIVEVPCSS